MRLLKPSISADDVRGLVSPMETNSITATKPVLIPNPGMAFVLPNPRYVYSHISPPLINLMINID